jgi:hypothetical protein
MAPPKPIRKRTVRVRLQDLKLLELNARYMRHETYKTLVANVKNDGGLLGNSPFACRVSKKGETHLEDGQVLKGTYLVLSGNHRTKAAMDAGVEFEDVTLTDDDLPEQRKVAVQLSQNALVGEDDPSKLKELYEQLDNVDWRLYSGLDDKTLDLLEKVDLGSLSEANLEFQTISMVFLPHEADRVKEAWDAAQDELKGRDEAWLAGYRDYASMLDALEVAGKAYGVSNVATSLSIVLDVFWKHFEDLQEGYMGPGVDGEDRTNGRQPWIPLSVIFEGFDVPPGAAMTIQRALRKMIDCGDASHPWQALEFMAAEYLAGERVG